MKMITVHFIPCVLMLFVLASTARSQTAPTPTPTPQPTPPANDIFLVELSGAKGQLSVGEPKRITTWEGYNNQPMFLTDGRALLYTSIRADRQADIYRYDLRDGSTARVTETTKTSEYSPTPSPDGKSISVIRVEEDGTQRLWMFPLAGQAAPKLILEKVKPVGYHVWIDNKSLMLFILGEPVTMQLVELRGERAEIIATNIGRSLHRVPRQRKVSFVRKFSEQQWVIQAFDTQTRAINTLIKTLPGSEDYTWTPQGTLLMASGSKLFKWNPSKDAGWQEVFDFGGAGLKAITRLSVSPKGDRLALVAQRAAAAP